VAEGFGLRRSDRHRRAISAYTWLTDRGPQKAWLHRIGKAEEAACPWGRPREDGHHITSIYPRFGKERRELIGLATTWE